MEYTVTSERQQRQPYAAIRTTIRLDGIGAAMGPILGELFGWLARKGITPVGPPWSRYLAVGPVECELELGAPIASEVAGEGRILVGALPECDVARTLHVGPYEQLMGAYQAIGDWMAKNAAVPAGAMWEVYLTDPEHQPDPATWQTAVYYPISKG